MTILVFLIVAVVLSFFDMRELKGKGQTREVVVYAVYVLLAIGLNVWYNWIINKISVADILLRLFNLKG